MGSGSGCRYLVQQGCDWLLILRHQCLHPPSIQVQPFINNAFTLHFAILFFDCHCDLSERHAVRKPKGSHYSREILCTGI